MFPGIDDDDDDDFRVSEVVSLALFVQLAQEDNFEDGHVERGTPAGIITLSLLNLYRPLTPSTNT